LNAVTRCTSDEAGPSRLSLVTCPVALYPAITEAEAVRFNLINPATNNRIQVVDLMEALRKSLSDPGQKPRAPSRRKAGAGNRRAA
jgi:non-homologous end joining protein Ku